MKRRLFEDLVVSAPAHPESRRRRAALLPASLALHAAVLTAAAHLAVTRPDVPSALPAALRWRAPAPAVPSTRAEAPAPRVRPPAVRPARANTSEERPALAPGPPAPVSETSPPSEAGDGPAVCLKNCEAAPGIAGSGDGAAGGGPDGGTAPGGSGPLRPGGEITAPTRIVYVPPVYPAIAIQAGVSGVVVLDCTIDRDGRVGEARVLRGHLLLSNAAVSAVRGWVYTPTRLNGVPVPVLLTVTVRFVARK